jgi:hypothetical protein
VTILRALLREPLLHFVVLGAGLFGLFHYVDRGDPTLDPRTILVDRGRLLEHLQSRSRAYDAARSSLEIDEMDARELEALIDDYVREEVLYREAKSLRMDENDFASRRRLVQQMEFVVGGFVGADPPTPREVEAYFSTHGDRYAEEPAITFTHVFFDQERHGARTLALARARLATLNELQASFADAPRHGDHFRYHVNYVQKAESLVANHFGPALARTVFTLVPDESRWQGPIQSRYGWHLVMLTSRREGGPADLASVRDRVEDDLSRERREERTRAALAGFIADYRVHVEPIRARVTEVALEASPRP